MYVCSGRRNKKNGDERKKGTIQLNPGCWWISYANLTSSDIQRRKCSLFRSCYFSRLVYVCVCVASFNGFMCCMLCCITEFSSGLVCVNIKSAGVSFNLCKFCWSRKWKIQRNSKKKENSCASKLLLFELDFRLEYLNITNYIHHPMYSYKKIVIMRRHQC